MTPGFHKLPTPLLCLILLGAFSGCSGVTIDPGMFAILLVTDPFLVTDPDSPNSHRTGKNHYEPVILSSNENMVRVKYLNVGPNAEHEQVMQLIFDHCDGTYIETNRVELRGYTTVDAECTHGTDSLQ